MRIVADKRTSLSLLALASGFSLALLAAGTSSLFFMLLPLSAFALGYFSSWRCGLLNGFVMLLSYTFAMSLVWTGGGPNLIYPLPYMVAFITGGFSLPLIGAFAPVVKKDVRMSGSIIVLIILAIAVGWCGYIALPRYGHYYQVVINSAENLEDLELYLPIGAVSGVPYKDLYSQPFQEVPLGALTEDFTQEIVDTGYGIMLKLAIPRLREDDVPEPRYTANIIFWQKNTPRKLVQLAPRQDVVPVDEVSWQRNFGPVKTTESLVIERFRVPVKITANKQAQIKLTLWNRTDRGESIDFFAYRKSDPYTERIGYNFQTGDGWVLAPVEVTSVMRISATTD